jgi:aryl carrier-like protein
VRVASTLSLGVAPFLAAADTVSVLVSEAGLAQARRQNLQYVLLDASWRVVNATTFDSLRRQPPLAAWSEPLLTSPLLFLEHSEYTGLGYQETLQLQRAAAVQSRQLRIYRLRP